MSRSVSKRSSRCGRRTLAVRLLVLLMVLVIVAPFASSSSEEQCQIVSDDHLDLHLFELSHANGSAYSQPHILKHKAMFSITCEYFFEARRDSDQQAYKMYLNGTEVTSRSPANNNDVINFLHTGCLNKYSCEGECYALTAWITVNVSDRSSVGCEMWHGSSQEKKSYLIYPGLLAPISDEVETALPVSDTEINPALPISDVENSSTSLNISPTVTPVSAQPSSENERKWEIIAGVLACVVALLTVLLIAAVIIICLQVTRFGQRRTCMCTCSDTAADTAADTSVTQLQAQTATP